jgi:hypothetical protein
MRPFVAGMLLLLAMENNLDAKHMDSDSGPVSRAERTGYTETSTYTDVMEFIAELQRKNAAVKLEYFATTPQGRKLPLVVLSKPSVTSPLDAAASGKPVVFVMANIHAGEVEGKEAMLHLMRDVSIGNLGGLLDKMVLLVAPIYNADGNDKIDINHRTEQNGPTGGVGTRENSAGLDLNRDFMKMESPEARGLIGNIFNRWDPQVVIDLHTTDGSYHGYALTYSPPLNPNTDGRIISLLRDKLLPDVTKTMAEEYRYKTYYYGNFVDPKNAEREQASADTSRPLAWATFDHRPRFGNNYAGLRNRIAILSEAYSYLDFRARVDVTGKFVLSILQYIGRHPLDITSAVRDSDRLTSETGRTHGNEEGFGITFERKPSERPREILVGSVTTSIDPRTNKPRLQATGEARPVSMIEYGEFRAVKRIERPAAYILKPGLNPIADMLMAHGVSVEVSKEETTLAVERYQVNAITHAARQFQGHKETKLDVTLGSASEVFPAGSFLVTMRQPKSALIFYLLEPESDDGLAAWNFLDSELERGANSTAPNVYPVYRLKQDPAMPREMLCPGNCK